MFQAPYRLSHFQVKTSKIDKATLKNIITPLS